MARIRDRHTGCEASFSRANERLRIPACMGGATLDAAEVTIVGCNRRTTCEFLLPVETNSLIYLGSPPDDPERVNEVRVVAREVRYPATLEAK